MPITNFYSKKSFSIFGIGLMIGTLCAFLLYFFVVSRPIAIGIAKLGIMSVPDALSGTVKVLNDINEVQSLGLIVERLKAEGFAKKIAHTIGNPQLERGIQQVRFGGLGWLSVRPLKDIGSIEVRVEAKDEMTSIVIAQSVLEEIVSEQDRIHAPFVLLLNSTLSDLDEQERIEVKKVSEWNNLLGDALSSLSTTDRAFLLTRQQIGHENVYKIRKTIELFKFAKIRNDIERPKILSPVALVRRSERILILMILLGGGAGLIGAFLSMQLYQLLKQGSPRPEKDEPSANISKKPL